MTQHPPRNPRFTLQDRSEPSSEFGSSGESERSEVRRVPEIRIAGGPAVAALFRHDPGRVLRFFYAESKARIVGDFCRVLAQRRLPYRMVSEAELEKIYGSSHHGGLVAIASPKPEHRLSGKDFALLKDLGPIHFVLDGIGNPHNIGAIARSLAFFGFQSLILSDDPRQAGLSDATYRVAEGGLETLTLFRVEALRNFLEAARTHFKVTGTTLSHQAQSARDLSRMPTPRLILLGNEEAGLSAQRLKSCDDLLMISGSGELQSLNVAQTAAILGYEFQPSTFVSKPALRPARRIRPQDSGAGRRAEGHPQGVSGNSPRGPAPKVAPQKKPRSAKGSRPGTKTPSR